MFDHNDSDDWPIVLKMSDCVREGPSFYITIEVWILSEIMRSPAQYLAIVYSWVQSQHSLLYFFGSLQDLDKFVVAYFREWAAEGVQC